MRSFYPIEIPNLETIQLKVIEIMRSTGLYHHPSITFTKEFNPEAFRKIALVPEIGDFLERRGWHHLVQNFIVNVIAPRGQFDIHEDPKLPGIAHHRILIPIENCVGTFTRVYSTDVAPTQQTYVAPNGDVHPYLKFELESCTLIDELELVRPHIVNTTPPHGVSNMNDTFRTNLWIDFYDGFNKIAEEYFASAAREPL